MFLRSPAAASSLSAEVPSSRTLNLDPVPVQRRDDFMMFSQEVKPAETCYLVSLVKSILRSLGSADKKTCESWRKDKRDVAAERVYLLAQMFFFPLQRSVKFIVSF